MRNTITVEVLDLNTLTYRKVHREPGTVRLRFANGMVLDITAQLDDAVALHCERAFSIQPVATNHVCLKWSPRP